MVDMIYNLLDKDHPMIHMKMEYAKQPEDRVEFSKDMAESMKEWGGIGLSANQVGLALRMFVFGDNKHYVPCFNPKILEYGGPEVAIEEGCLTYPGLWLKVSRPETVQVVFEDEFGETQKRKYSGLEARVFQHEMDHMEGTDFTQKVSKLKLDLAMKRRNKQLKKSEQYREFRQLT